MLTQTLYVVAMFVPPLPRMLAANDPVAQLARAHWRYPSKKHPMPVMLIPGAKKPTRVQCNGKSTIIVGEHWIAPTPMHTERLPVRSVCMTVPQFQSAESFLTPKLRTFMFDILDFKGRHERTRTGETWDIPTPGENITAKIGTTTKVYRVWARCYRTGTLLVQRV